MENAETACSGVILTGGLSRRLSGTNKAFVKVGDRRIIDRIDAVFRAVFDEIIIVSNQPAAYLEFDATIAADIFTTRSSLTGIHAGLFYAANPFVFIAACDTPFLQENLVRSILNRIEARDGVVIPETAAGMEPLCAVYAKTCLPLIERQIRAEKFKIQRFFKSIRIHKLAEDYLRQADSELESFFNINTYEDLARAEALAQQQRR